MVSLVFVIRFFDPHLLNIELNVSVSSMADYYHFPYGKHYVKLTKRESHCYYHLIRHDTTAAIADKLKLSVRTVEMHVGNIKHKLECHRNTQLIEIAFKYNLHTIEIKIEDADEKAKA